MLTEKEAPRTGRGPALVRLLAAAFALCSLAHTAAAQSLSLDRARSREMLQTIKEEVKKHYYDPTFRGINLDERFKQADERLKAAGSRGEMFGIIAQTLIEFDDSHTYFLPPGRTSRVDYGWRMQMFGDRCYVTAVKPGSDAEAKGLKPGDLVLQAGGFQLTRENLWKFHYLFNVLKPQAGMNLVVQSPGGEPRRLDVLAKVRQLKLMVDLTDGNEIFKLMREEENDEYLNRHRFAEAGEVLVWKMPQFDLSREKVEDIFGRVRKHKALVLDLRGNGGGAEETLVRMVGSLFKQDLKIGDLKRRKDEKPLVARTRGSDAYDGKLVVLVDSQSGSAAELLARVVQLEKRGAVVGDRTMGAVMRGRGAGHQVGADVVVFYGVSVTDADLVMTDGKSLEKTGVTPDELRLPTAEDLAAQRDPVLAYALSLAGAQTDPVKAGALFPVEWRRN